MEHPLYLYNTLSRKKENFIPSNPPFAGMYVCGPTVYGHAHLGNARPAVTFDLLFRYLKYLGYKVRYVRNITDVGHLVDDADEGEDKIQKRARIEKLEPMEVVQYFTESYHHNMAQLNVQNPSIEPRASGHIIEQQQLIDKILENGFAYVVNGSVYFDVEKYHQKYHYGKLSGRILEDLINTTRELDGQAEKRSPLDFALWKKAQPEHIMHWPSKWSEGFPGWHLECSSMSVKYLGEVFDIHGGGMDLLFPHHECEIAQSVAATGKEAVRYWIHNNLITINGQKMAKSLGNAVSLNEIFSGNHPLLEKAYNPVTIRFFILTAHYRSTLDFSNEALQAAEKGLQRLLNAAKAIKKIPAASQSTVNIEELRRNCFDAMNDDLNSPVALANLFEGVRIINSANDGKEKLTTTDIDLLQQTFDIFLLDILGLEEKNNTMAHEKILDNLIENILKIRQEAKLRKDFTTSDQIRDMLQQQGIIIKDRKDGCDWEIKI